MKIIVGLGNSGTNFESTRHNLGFKFVEKLSKSLGTNEFREKGNGVFSSGSYLENKFIILKSKTFMNNSGECVSYFSNYFKVPTENVLVIYDDITMPLAKIRFRDKGSSGGHNGIKSIIRELKSDKFSRIKVGIGHNEKVPLDQWVIQNFEENEARKLHEIYEKVKEMVLNWLDKETK
jgi:peptidyl-tRNA hydrolase, PTH1 family